jgi:hypothetical protein
MLVPPEEWITDPSHTWIPDGVCPSCSAVVQSRVSHRDWHLAIIAHTGQYVNEVLREWTRYYVSPPVSGSSNVRNYP